jgi:hypothetical protein
LYKDSDVTVEKCDHCDHMSVHIRDEDQENWCLLRDGEATSAFKVGKTMGYQYGYNEGKKDGERLAVFGELSHEAARTGLDDATNYLPTD